MEMNVGDHSTRLIDVEQDVDRLQSENRTTSEFVSQKLSSLSNNVQSTQDDLRRTQSRLELTEQTMIAMGDTLRGLTAQNEQIQTGWVGILQEMRNLPLSISNSIDTWASINLRGNQPGTRVVTEAQLHGPTTKMWFGDITTQSQPTDRHTPPRPIPPSQHTMSTDPSPNKFFHEYCQSSEYGQDVFQDVDMAKGSSQERVRDSVEGRVSRMEEDVSKEGEVLPAMAGLSELSRPEASEQNQESMQEGATESVEGREVSTGEVSNEGEQLSVTGGQSAQGMAEPTTANNVSEAGEDDLPPTAGPLAEDMQEDMQEGVSKAAEESSPTAGQLVQRGAESSVEPIDANIGVSPLHGVQSILSPSTATDAVAGEVGEGEQLAAVPIPTAPPVGSSFNTAPMTPASPTVIPPTPTSSVHATGSSLVVPLRSSGWRSPSSSSPPLTRSRSRSRTPLPFSAEPGNEKQQVRKK